MRRRPNLSIMMAHVFIHFLSDRLRHSGERMVALWIMIEETRMANVVIIFFKKPIIDFF